MNEQTFQRCSQDRKNPYVLVNSEIIHSGILTLEDIGYYICWEAENVSWDEIPLESRERITKAFELIKGV